MTEKMFFGDPVRVARFDKQTYPIFEKLTKQQIGYIWTPEEVIIERDREDFRKLPEADQHIFTSNIKRQIVLDTEQGASPAEAFLPIATLPELQAWITAWTFSETIHSRSYQYILQNVYSNPSEVLDSIMDIKPIVELSDDISACYDELIRHNAIRKLNDESSVGEREFREFDEKHKEALWFCINSVNILEGLRFYVSFACSWAFAERKQMEGNAKIIKLICRDENLHLASTQHMLKLLQKEDPFFAELAKREQDRVVHMFEQGVNQEKKWAEYLFQHGSMVGLNYEMLCDEIEWIANKRMHTLGLPSHFKGGARPLPWMQKWISGSDVQVAPQETEISSYIVGGVKKDVSADTFKGLIL